MSFFEEAKEKIENLLGKVKPPEEEDIEQETRNGTGDDGLFDEDDPAIGEDPDLNASDDDQYESR
ncbi:hypothetical protein CQ010_12260 [Arthrobacter sp. MYb211]|uniref:hypothetical protein n=1 Tax=Micrococcaceae TaxID=1268 RepID=UPI000CFA9C87|nr:MULTISPECIES: hypothetical protein [unclassified Arthrobacter]PRA14051.1 hypothetical protein CQ015_01890 [Arthrobacter sp. MYb221]PRC06594.1 hypothetical protein CQ010_12260 [Arthrobacter sp. MYb211]